nr:syndecan [Leptinotarsa decemlineata]
MSMAVEAKTIKLFPQILKISFGFQNNQRSSSSDLTFKEEDSAIEGSGYNGEVTHDLESSGSGFGPDDEDDHEPDVEKPRTTYINQNPVFEPTAPRNRPDELDIDKEIPIEPKRAPEPTPDTSVRMNPKPDDRPTSFFAQPGILAAVIGGAVVGLLCAILVVMFIVYRMRKKDEGSYALGEPKQSPNSNSYSRAPTNKEFYA